MNGFFGDWFERVVRFGGIGSFWFVMRFCFDCDVWLVFLCFGSRAIFGGLESDFGSGGEGVFVE